MGSRGFLFFGGGVEKNKSDEKDGMDGMSEPGGMGGMGEMDCGDGRDGVDGVDGVDAFFWKGMVWRGLVGDPGRRWPIPIIKFFLQGWDCSNYRCKTDWFCSTCFFTGLRDAIVRFSTRGMAGGGTRGC